MFQPVGLHMHELHVPDPLECVKAVVHQNICARCFCHRSPGCAPRPNRQAKRGQPAGPQTRGRQLGCGRTTTTKPPTKPENPVAHLLVEVVGEVRIGALTVERHQLHAATSTRGLLNELVVAPGLDGAPCSREGSDEEGQPDLGGLDSPWLILQLRGGSTKGSCARMASAMMATDDDGDAAADDDEDDDDDDDVDDDDDDVDDDDDEDDGDICASGGL